MSIQLFSIGLILFLTSLPEVYGNPDPDRQDSSFSGFPIVVVVTKNSEIDSLDLDAITNIFLARSNRFPNGIKAIPIELSDREIRGVFYKLVSGKSPRELTAYWTTLIFSGKGRPPKGYSSVKTLISRLESSPSSISYLSLAQVTDDLKVVYQFP